MEKNGWKITAIIFISITALYTLLGVWGYVIMEEEAKNEAICAYEICNVNQTYYYFTDTKLCNCYQNDLLGNPIIVNSEIVRGD